MLMNKRPRDCGGRFWAATQGEGRAQRAPQAQQPAESTKSVRGGAFCLNKSRPTPSRIRADRIASSLA
jgi:hypothetical protein